MNCSLLLDENCDHLGGFEKSNDFSAIMKEGYRHGKQKTDEKEMQTGFDTGFVRGACYGKLSGTFYANCLLDRGTLLLESSRIKEHNSFKQDLKSLLYDDFDVSGEEKCLVDMFVSLDRLIGAQNNNESLVKLCEQFRQDIKLHTP